MIKGAPERFAIDRHDLPGERLVQGRGPPHKALRQFVGLEPGQHPAKGIVRGNTMGEGQELLEPLRLGLPILFHVFPALRSAEDGAQGNDKNIE